MWGLYFYWNPIKITFPNVKIISTWCILNISWENIEIKDLTDKYCKIFIFPKLDKKYSFQNYKQDVRFKKDDVILLTFKVNPKTYSLKTYIKDYLNWTEKLNWDTNNYLKSLFLVKLRTKFKLNWKIKNIKLYKIIESVNSKDLKDFWIKQETWVLVEQVIDKNILLKRWFNDLLHTQLKEISIKINYLSWNANINFVLETKWKYLFVFKWRYNYKYFVSFWVKKEFERWDYSFSLNKERFSFKISSKFPFKKEETEQNIKKFFKPYIVKFDWQSNKKLRVFYYIPPKKNFFWGVSFSKYYKTYKNTYKNIFR